MSNRSKAERLQASRKQTEDLLKRVGYVGGSTYSEGIPNYKVDNPVALSNKVTYNTSSRRRTANKYTGDEIIGIAVMHKSNAVPIRSKKSAEEIAKMRRG